MLWLIHLLHRTQSGQDEGAGLCAGTVGPEVPGVRGQREAPMRMRYLLSHMRWHGSRCLGVLFRLQLQLLLQDRGILQWLWLAVHVLHGCSLCSPGEKLGSMPSGCRH